MEIEEMLYIQKETDKMLKSDLRFVEKFEYLPSCNLSQLNHIGSGENAKIFSLDNDVAFKVANHFFNTTPESGNTFFYLLREYEKQKQIFEDGIYFPKAYGVFRFKYNGQEFPGIAMRDLGRKSLDKIKNPFIVNKVVKSWEAELEKAKNLGYKISDPTPMNAIWVPEEKQTYLIDCDHWYKSK